MSKFFLSQSMSRPGIASGHIMIPMDSTERLLDKFVIRINQFSAIASLANKRHCSMSDPFHDVEMCAFSSVRPSH